jgi:hypothetical protein
LNAPLAIAIATIGPRDSKNLSNRIACSPFVY